MNNNLIDRMRKQTAACFTPGQTVIVGVSGGADSMALLDCLLHTGKSLSLQVAHLNHSLRGEEAERDQRFVKGYCTQKQIPCHLLRLPIAELAQQRGCSIEECGRIERYRFFQSLCPTDGRIATAHTLSDRTETMLFHLIRGTSSTGFAAIPKENGAIIRPLLSFTRTEIEEYCQQCFIPYQSDSSNFSRHYTRNRIRLDVLTTLRQLNSQTERHAEQWMDQLQQDDRYLFSLAGEHYKGMCAAKQLDLSKWQSIPTVLQRRVLVLFLKEQKIAYNQRLLNALVTLCDRQNGQCNLPGRRYARAWKGRLFLYREKQTKETFCYALQPDARYHFPKLQNLSIQPSTLLEYDEILNNLKNPFISALDYATMKGALRLRSRRPGDRIRLPKRPEKTVKKWMNECEIPPFVRDRLAVLEDELGIVWVQNVGISERTVPSESTSELLLLLWNKST